MEYPGWVAQGGEKLWGYASLARLWSWTLIAVAVLLLGLSIGIQAATEEGLDGRWWAAALGITGLTGVISYPFFRVWLRKTALPSVRLPQAVRASGPRRLEATSRDWRRWALFTGAVLFVGGAAMLTFLVGVLGRGGIAEGVVVGMIAAGASRPWRTRGASRGSRPPRGGATTPPATGRPGWATASVWLPRRPAGDAG